MRLKVDPINTQLTEIKLHQVSRVLEISFDNDQKFDIPFEYLRVYTPSAEALGHGPGQEILQMNKQDVTITSIKPVGNYGITPEFSDGHDTGIYTWPLLYKLGNEFDQLWPDYLERLALAGHTRIPPKHAN